MIVVQPDQHVRQLLNHRKPDECYLMATQGRIYAVYFPSGGQMSLDEESSYVRWLEMDTVKWADNWADAQSVGKDIIE